MKIQRWSDRAGCGMTVNDEGRYVQFSDIAHLLPTENPEWEPCGIQEADRIMNAKGEVIAERYRPDAGPDAFAVYASTLYLGSSAMSDFCLTPVRRRKVEPVVFEAFTCNGGLVVADSRLKDGQKVRVTVEVIQGEK